MSHELLKERESMSAAAPGVIELTEQNFAASIDGHPFAVVAFWAPGSAPWREFAPTFGAAAARHREALFAQVNVEQHQTLGEQFNISAIPTLMILRSNIVVHAHAGLLEAGALDQVLAAVSALDMEEVRRQVVSVGEIALDTPAAQATVDADSIESYLRPSLRGPAPALREVAARLAGGGLVAIRDAFDPDFAERMHRSLDRCTTWRLFEGYEESFHYHHHNLYDPAEFPPDLAECSKVFHSPATKEWMARLSDRSCAGPTEFSASWYLPGDHSLPHNDIAASGTTATRQVAFVWHLAKDWRSEWGGALFWCSKGVYLPPVFNTLWLFNVGPESNHFVTHVSPYAQGKRLAINGWWTGTGATGAAGWNGPERIGGDGAGIAIY
jgi:hypothetical protein